MVLTLLLAAAVVVVAPLAPAPTSAVPWPPAPNMVPGPNSAPGSPFWGGGGGGNAAKGGATNPSCPPVESWEPCRGEKGRGREGKETTYVLSKPLIVDVASWWKRGLNFTPSLLQHSSSIIPCALSFPLPKPHISDRHVFSVSRPWNIYSKHIYY